MRLIHYATTNVDLTSIQLKKSVYRTARNHEQYTSSHISLICLQAHRYTTNESYPAAWLGTTEASR